jgi:uncharacterized membrane protein YoaK (UPF0700 family)
MQTLHKPDEVFSLRHVPSWLMLSFAAGAVNAVTLLACQRFVTHVTGTVTRLGVEVARFVIMLDYALVILCFVAGAMVAGLFVNGRAHRGLHPWFAVPLWAATAATAGVALAGAAGWLGTFGGEVDQPGDFLLLGTLSFAMGLQNAAVATSTGLLVRTTHLTGPATDLGIHIAELLFANGAARRLAGSHAALRASKIVAFAVGATVAVPLAARAGFLAYLLPAIMTAAATILSFVRTPTTASDKPARVTSA